MAPLTLEGDTLGQRHQHYNKLIHEAVTSTTFQLTNINYNDSDIENLLKIDTACKTRNVEYIIDVLKCSDMLYVSRAIKQSTWLINDTQYAYIIEPNYLFTQLFPHMHSKAVNKLLLHIRLHLKDQKRVEVFYEYLKDKTDESWKWLQNCSEDFIENVLQSRYQIPESLFLRLCKRSFKFAEYHANVSDSLSPLQHVRFLVNKHTDEYFALIEKQIICNPYYNKKCTKKIMKTCPNKILDNFYRYFEYVDLSVVAKYVKKENLKEFLLKQLKNPNFKYFFYDHNKVKHFIKRIPKDERLNFVKNTLIDKTEVSESKPDDECNQQDECGTRCMGSYILPKTGKDYRMYQYLPFDIAFAELKKAIRLESAPTERNLVLEILITCAKNNLSHTKTLLQFYHDKHINEPFKYKVEFVNNLLTRTPVHKFDTESWNNLNELFHSMEVYSESKHNVQTCLKYIVLYQVLHDEKVPEIVDQKLEFDTFKKIQSKLNTHEKTKLFDYLWNRLTREIQNIETNDSEKFDAAIITLTNGFNFLNDWKKSLADYSILLNKLKELLQIKRNRGWKADVSPLHTINKSWRKHMFEYSLVLHPSEEACLNALKHGPQLLADDEQVAALRADDSVSLRRMLTKLRVYWPHSIAQQWTDAYFGKLNNISELTPVIKGLFTLLPLAKILDIAKKHMPEDGKIKWSETDPLEIGLRKNIAMALHLARPQPPLNSVLWYAKDDYLQYAVPSLNAITQNFSKIECSKHILVLLDAPVSLQKLGLQLVFDKLSHEEQREIFYNNWKTTENSSIRTILFTRTHKLLCKSKYSTNCENLWKLLSMFLDNLGTDENNQIYKTLSEAPSAKDVPPAIKGEYFMKAYLYVTSLPAKSNCESYISRLLDTAAPEAVASLSSDFVVNKLLAPVKELLTKPKRNYIPIISAYILRCHTEEEQLEKYKAVLAPALDHAFQSWDDEPNNDYRVKVTYEWGHVDSNKYHVEENFIKLIQQLTVDFRKLATLNKGVNVTKVFEAIKNDIEQKLSLEENYVLYTCWKLTTEYVRLVNEHKSILNDPRLEDLEESDIGRRRWMTNDCDDVWQELHFKLSPALALIIVKYLKEDVKNYFPSISTLFESGFDKMIYNLELPKRLLLETLRCMLVDEDFIPLYVMVCNVTPKYGDDDDEKLKIIEIRNKIASHPSKEVKVHYHREFGIRPFP